MSAPTEEPIKRRRTVVKSQRYNREELGLLEAVAGRNMGAFIHDAAVERAREKVNAVTST